MFQRKSRLYWTTSVPPAGDVKRGGLVALASGAGVRTRARPTRRRSRVFERLTKGEGVASSISGT